MSFRAKLEETARANDSWLCVGLDPVPSLLPSRMPRTPEGVVDFNRAIVEATSDLVCAYKPNLAFYEALGVAGIQALNRTLEHIPNRIPVIADAKRGDIGSTSRAYARALFDAFGFDAATVNPYLGHDALLPFLEYADRGIFVLCRTSNAGAADFQDLVVGDASQGTGKPLYQVVAERSLEWNTNGNVGLVVGATYPEELRAIRSLAKDVPLLVPGVGAQGGELAESVRAGVNSRGELAVFNSSRQVIYASAEPDFAAAARRAALALRDEINRLRRC